MKKIKIEVTLECDDEFDLWYDEKTKSIEISSEREGVGQTCVSFESQYWEGPFCDKTPKITVRELST